MHEAGHSKPVSWENPEEWSGEGVGRGIQDERDVPLQLIHVDVWQKPPQYYKLISLQLKFKEKKMLAPWKKSYDKPRQHIKKQRYYFATMVHLVKAMVFPVVTYGCESWIIKKAES